MKTNTIHTELLETQFPKMQTTKQVDSSRPYLQLFKDCLDSGKQYAKHLKREMAVIQLAITDERCPKSAKLIAALSIAYALSPIDLIPDFIPVLGYLDDIIIVPAGLTLALKLIPKEVMDKAREQVDTNQKLPKNKYAGAAVIGAWSLCGGYAAYKVGKWCGAV